MKKLLQFIIALLLLTPCNAQTVNLSLNLKKGETYKHVQRSKATIIETINGKEVNMVMTIYGKTTYLVQDINDQYYSMEVTFRNLNMKMELPQKTMEFSSSKNDTSDILSTLLSEMTNKPFYIKLTKTGKVEQVQGLDSLFVTLFKRYPHLPEATKQQLKDQLMKSYGEKAMKGSIEMITAIFPDKPVALNGKWIINTQLESGMAANMQTTFQYTGETDSIYIIHGDGKIKTADKDAYIESNGMPLKYDLAGTMTSDIRVNRNSGWVVEAKISQEIKGTAEVKDNPKIPGGMVIPMTIINETEIKN